MKLLLTAIFTVVLTNALPQAGTLLDLNTAQPTPPTGLTLSVPNASIVANFSFSPNGGPLFTAVQFVDLTQGGPTSWSWNFGDGGTSTSQNPLHTFSSGGVFTVSLTATGPGGSSSTNRSVTITVASGQPIWLDHFGSTGVDFGSAVVIDSASNSYVGGSFSGTVDFGGRSMTSVGSYDVFLNKYDSTGALQWCSRFGGTDGEQMKSLALDPTGNLLFSCNFITTNSFSQDSSSGQVVFPSSQTRLDDVTVLHVNQTTTTYHAAANTDVARGEALFEAVTNGTAGDILYLRSETYDVGTNNVLRLDQHGTPGLSIVGNGAANTFVQTETDANVVFTFVRLGNGSVVSDLTLNNNAPPGTFSFPTGAFNGNGFTNALLLRLHINGGSDCIYVTVNNSTLEVRDCVLTSHYDCYNISSSNGVINVFNTPSTSTATSASGFPNAAFGMTMGAGTFNVYNVTATGTGGAQENRGFGVGLNGTVNLYNCHAVTSGFDAHDLISTFGGGNFNVTPDTTYTTTDFSSGGGLTNIGKVGSLVKLSPQGTLVWTSGPTPTNSQQGVNFTRIATDSSGNVAVAGDFNAPFASQMAFGTGVALSSAFGSQDAFLAKYDTNGGCLWAKDFANTGDSELGTAVAVDTSDNIYTGGYALSGINLGGGLMTNYVYGAFGFLGKFNPSGAFQWQRRVAEALSTDTSIGPFGRIRYLTLDTNQDVTLSGEYSVHANLAGEPMDTSNYVITATSPTYDAYIAKYASANGAFQRAATIRGNETAQTVGLAVDSKNNVYGVGFFYGTYNFGGTTLTTFGGVPNISSDGFTAKFDPNLALVWVKQFGSASDGDQGTGIALDSGGYPVITGGYYGTAQYFGWTFTNAGSTDIVIARILP